jgi:hypothetical protein
MPAPEGLTASFTRVFDCADESWPASPREFLIQVFRLYLSVFDFNCKEQEKMFIANKV